MMFSWRWRQDVMRTVKRALGGALVMSSPKHKACWFCCRTRWNGAVDEVSLALGLMALKGSLETGK